MLPIPDIGGIKSGIEDIIGGIGDIFGGGKDYISAQIGAFGGGGKRNLALLPDDLKAFHYSRVTKKLNFESVVSPTKEQKSLFWTTWDAMLGESTELLIKVKSGDTGLSNFPIQAGKPFDITTILLIGGIFIGAILLFKVVKIK